MVGKTVMYKLEWRSIWYDRHPMAQRGVSMGQSLNLKQYQCDAPVPILVERFDIEPSSDFSSKWSNFIRLVLCCIDATFCKKIFVGKALSSWRDLQDLHAFAPLRPQYCRKFSSNFFAFFGKICKIRYFWILFTDFCSDFDEILSEFRR